MKALILKVIFVFGLAIGLVMVLTPNLHGAPHGFLPRFLRTWVNTHDNAANMAAFFLIIAVGLRLPCSRAKVRMGLPAKVLQILGHPLGRVAGFMLLVCSIEFTQFFIPGRVADLNDVCTGWSGIFAAWLLSVLLDARTENSGDIKSLAD